MNLRWTQARSRFLESFWYHNRNAFIHEWMMNEPQMNARWTQPRSRFPDSPWHFNKNAFMNESWMNHEWTRDERNRIHDFPKITMSSAGDVPSRRIGAAGPTYCVTFVIDDEVDAVQGERLCASGATQESLVVPWTRALAGGESACSSLCKLWCVWQWSRQCDTT